ncbi:hypothetical protein [Cognatiluteimonas telluris]|jgi:hypothetical protein|uniref:hypothetical protein n=1 Tax=Cognatiluteimonas telluris TaxID=1104775 RepID=UPI001407C8E1|nr:hypothetical protein [Lysobacter telluris]
MRRSKPARAACIALLLALSACATGGDRSNALDKLQYAWSAAIRWGDFEGAWNMLDPAYRAAHPMTGLEFERYKQLQISAYHDLGAQLGDGTALREVEIGVINRNTLVERQARYTEQWRYDPVAKTWWVESGLPDLWQAR